MNIAKNSLRKNIEIAVCLALVCSIFLSFARFDAACEDLRKNVFRLHIKANSDSKADQQVKLKVRDAILENSVSLFDGAKELDDAIVLAQTNIEELTKIANEVLQNEGFDYKATARIGEAFFETREYEEFTLPAGTYESLIIDLGKAQGQNWWCVIFPKLCIDTSIGEKASLEDTASKQSAKIAENKPKYKVKFKVVEWYEKLKRKFNW